VDYLRHYHGIFLQGLRKTTKYLSEDSGALAEIQMNTSKINVRSIIIRKTCLVFLLEILMTAMKGLNQGSSPSG
jgi:hypothetical protein